MKDIIILYVEDEPGIREGLSRFINRFAKELFIASDGKEGLELYKEHKPDLVISDIKMPNMTGIDMVKAIKKIDKEQNIIFTTAHSDSEFFLQAIDMQVDGYILKPVDLDLLDNKITSISKVIQLKKDFDKQQKQLIASEKMAALGNMANNIAHQWRQPLSVISTCATGIMMQKEMNILNDEYLIETCELINDNSQYLSKTIDDFRDFIEDKQTSTPFNIKDVLYDVLNMLSIDIEHNHIILVKNIELDVSLTGYLEGFKQVIINIINNANDVLTKNIHNENERYIFLETKLDNNNVVIYIKDSAGGIAENIKNNIFEPYTTTKHQSIGTGLGLYISYKTITDKFDGTIDVENMEYEYKDKKYVGAQFIIKIPIK